MQLKSAEILKSYGKSPEKTSGKTVCFQFLSSATDGSGIEFFMTSCKKNTKTTSFNYEHLAYSNYFLERERERERLL
jgi:hypothetical protein